MELNEKLQELRKKKGLTQEELAEKLYVSRTAISKWESGRGVPSVDSLKAISTFFSVSLDDLLSGEELLVLAEDDRKQKESHTRDVMFGLFDCCMALLFFLPLFGQKTSVGVRALSLLALSEGPLYLKILYTAVVLGMTMLGLVTLALQNSDQEFWLHSKTRISLFVHVSGLLLFIMSRQPYAAVYTLIFLLLKVQMLIKQR